MSEYLQKVIFLSQSDYDTLAGGGTVSHNGTTFSGLNSSYMYLTDAGVTSNDLESMISTSISSGDTNSNLPTTSAVASFVEGKGYTTDTDTHRVIKVNGTEKLSSSSTTALDLVGGSNISLTENSGVITIANTYSYTHPSGDGNLHVPANGTSNNGKFLKATGTAGSYEWDDLPSATSSVAGITTVGAAGGAAAYDHTHSLTITANATDGLWDLTGTNGSNAVTYELGAYSSKQTGASFYTGTTAPDLTTRLNYDGYLYATKLYSGGNEVLTSHAVTHTYVNITSGGATSDAAGSDPYLHIYDDNTLRDTIHFLGSGSTKVTSSSNKAITIKNNGDIAYCDTTGNVAEKTATMNDYTLRSGNTFLLKIKYSNSATSALTLNVNNTGAKSIRLNNLSSSSTNYTLPAGVYLVQYDSLNNWYQIYTNNYLPGAIKNIRSAYNTQDQERSVLFSVFNDDIDEHTDSLCRNDQFYVNPAQGTLTAPNLVTTQLDMIDTNEGHWVWSTTSDGIELNYIEA